MHPIQRHILKQLTLNEYQRYSDLRPEDVEGNLFMYHVEQLISGGLVERNDKRYTLSSQGKKHAGIINVDTGVPRPQPKITTTVIARNDKGEYLLFKWNRQPFIHKTSFIYGKTDYGKSIWDNARRELTMKASVEAEMEWIGDVYVQALEGDQTINHVLTHVFEANGVEGKVESTVPTGQSFWGNVEDYPSDELVPGTREILELYKNSPRPFLDEITVAL